jgi:glucokinase
MRNYQQSAKAIHELAQRQQLQALGAFHEFGIHLGNAMKTILFMYAPEAIILGGSISNAYPFFKDSMETTLATFTLPRQLEKLTIACSHGSNLPILGAAALCLAER